MYVRTWMDRSIFLLSLFDRSDCIFYLFRWVFTNLQKKKQVGKLQVILFLVIIQENVLSSLFSTHFHTYPTNFQTSFRPFVRAAARSTLKQLNSYCTKTGNNTIPHTHAHTSIHTYICKLADWETEIRRQKQKATIQKNTQQ